MIISNVNDSIVWMSHVQPAIVHHHIHHEIEIPHINTNSSFVTNINDGHVSAKEKVK